MAEQALYQVDPYFETSYSEHSLYPTNLVYRASYRKVLESYKNRLDKACSKLLFKEATKNQLDVRFREYDSVEKGLFPRRGMRSPG